MAAQQPGKANETLKDFLPQTSSNQHRTMLFKSRLQFSPLDRSTLERGPDISIYGGMVKTVINSTPNIDGEVVSLDKRKGSIYDPNNYGGIFLPD
ncbi:hypothetical protein ACTXT7_017295 [Hymenolepis weldensis]